MTRNVLSLEEAKRKFKNALSARFEGKRTTAVAVVTSVERDTVSLHTTGKVRATIDGVSDQSVFVGAGTGVAVGESLRVENRAGGIGPEWVSLGKTGSVAGSEGSVDTGRPLTTPPDLSLTTGTYVSATTVLARITVEWEQIGDWEAASHYEVAYYLDSDAANQHVSTAPHVNGQLAVQYAILALLPGTDYTVKVRALGYGGSLSSWATASITTATDSSIPTVPTGFGAIQISDTALRFYWAQNPDPDFSYYEIGVFSGTNVVDDLLSGYPLSTGDTPEHIHNVTPATNRYFRVRSVDTSGNASAWSTPLSGPHATVETITGSLVLSDIINQSYGLGLTGTPSKIIIDLATASGLAFEGGTGNLMLDDSVAGAGLTVASKVLAVSADRLLSVASDAVGITAGSTYQFIGTGSGTAAGWQSLSGLAGNGLTHTAGVLAVGVKEGVEIDADALRVNKSYDYTWTGIHTFQTNDVQMDVNLDFVGPQSITTSSGALSISPNNGSLLLDANLDFVGPQSITTSSGDLTLSPFTAVLIPGTKILGSSSFDSSFPVEGWRINETAISGQSALTIGVISADELFVKVFVADETRVDRGDEFWTKSYGILSEPFTTPAISGTVTVTFEDSPAITGAIFTVNDWLLFRKIDITSGLTVASLWGQVSGYVDNDNDTQSWTYTHRSGAAGVSIKKGDIGIDFGASGAALIHLSVIDPAGAPYIKMRRWAGANPYTPANYTTYVQLGNLGSIGNPNYTPTGDGLWVRSTADDGQFIVADNVGLQIRGADFYLYSGASPVFKIDHSVPSLALGATLPTAYGNTGVWMGLSGGAYKASIGNATEYLRWDGTNLSLAGSITILNPGDIDASAINNDEGWTDDTAANAAQSTANTAVSNAATAQSAANAAQSSANTALSTLSDIASDGLLTPVEKPAVIRDYNVIIAEQSGIDAQATSYGVTTTKTAYDNAITALTAYLDTLTSAVLWSNLTGNTTVVGATFRTNFETVYTTRQALLNAIAAAAKVLADAAQDAADTAQAAANAAAASAATAINNAATAQATADGKIETYFATTAPGGASVGDLWFDTDDGNKLYRHNGTTWVEIQDDAISTALANAATAQSTADGKIVTFYATTAPGTGALGDLWFDTDDGNKIYRHNGTTWVSVQDTGIGIAIAAAATAQSTADGKIDTYYAATAPTGASLGDLWFDTDDGNKLYRHNGTTWVEIQDDGIAAAISAAAGAQATADGKVTTYYSVSSSPPAAPVLGDLWYQTDTYLVKRWSGSAWATIANAYTNTNQLTDGANLGGTANWTTITAIPPRFGDSPGASGLYVTASYMGYYTGSAWNTYLGNDGTMWLKGGTAPDGTNGYHGLWWDAPNEKLHIYGDLTLNNSPDALGGDSIGPQLTIGEYGLIKMDANGQFSMGADSSFAAGTGSTFTIGTQGTGAYLSYVDGVLSIEGMLTVTDGADFLPAAYRPTAISASFFIDNYGSTAYILAAPPYAVDEFMAGRLETADGNIYFLKASSTYVMIATTGSRYAKISVLKAGTGSLDTPTTFGAYSDVLIVYANTDETWNALSQENKDNRVLIADAYFSADFTEILTLTMRAESAMSIIGPDFIRTENLSALSADLGTITGGKITLTNATNTLWLNDGTGDVVLAAGVTADGIAAATFKVWENGSVNLGSAALGKYVNWNTSTGALIVKGDIRADAGYLGSLDVDGNLTMSGGKIQWNSNNSYIDDNKIVVEDASGYSTLLVGDRSQSYYGVLDITLDAGGDGGWRYGIRLVDGGNTIANTTALYRGVSGISGVNSVDRIFSAATATGSYSDGFYADMAASATWNNFDTAGVPFKGIHQTGGPVALFNQETGGADAPVIWASSNNNGRSIIISEMGQPNQIAFRVIDNGNSGYALWTDGQKIDMGDARIENMNIINFTTSVSGTPPWTPVVNFGGASDRTVVKWLRLEIAGTVYQIPLFANGSFN